MNRMPESPRRPIILKKRKLPFQRNESDRPQIKSAPVPGAPSFPDGICIIDHPTMQDTQVVMMPKNTDLQSVIDVLTAKGKEHGPRGPNKFILLTGNNGLEDGVQSLCHAPSKCKITHGPKASVAGGAKTLQSKRLKSEPECTPLNESLTNMQWFGKMNVRATGAESATNDSFKENVPAQEPQNARCVAKGHLSEKPPYSYMAMIQFAINSKTNKKMTLKEIYKWIEDHFPYFRTFAKPGWKNSIRHNLSLHDMFIRETTPNGKISYWTIKPEANRCLTLDQVYEPVTVAAAPSYPQIMQVFYQQQQNRVIPDVKKATPCTTERKMKPLLPRTDPYLLPIQLPLSPSLFVPSLAALPVSTTQQTYTASDSVSTAGGKRQCIAHKVPKTESSSVVMSTPGPEVKEEQMCVAVSAKPCSYKRKDINGSRRKQRLISTSTEEPVQLFQDSTIFDSGMDITTVEEVELRAELRRENETFKTPIKARHLASSTPSKALESSRITPLGKGSQSVLDFSPIRTPQQPEHTGLNSNSTPFKDLQVFSSPQELHNSFSRDHQTGSSNRTLTEGLVLDTMNDSLSKIFVDISFSGLDDDDLGIADLSWSQIIPEMK